MARMEALRRFFRAFSIWPRVFGHVRPYFRRLWCYYIFIAGDALLTVLNPLLVIFLLKAVNADGLFPGAKSPSVENFYGIFRDYTGIRGNRDPADIVPFLIILAGVTSIGVLCAWFIQYNEGHFSWRILIDIRRKIWAHLIRLPLSFHDRRRSGEIISRMTNDLQQLHRGVTQLFGDFLVEPPKILAVLVGGVLIDWRVSLLVFVIFPIFAVVFLVFGRRVKKFTKRRLQKQAALTDSMSQMLAGIREIKAFGLEPQKLGELSRTDEGILKDVKGTLAARGWMKGFVECMAILVPGLGIIVFSYIFPVSITIVVGFAMWSRQAYGSMKKLAAAINVLQEGAPAAERLFALVDENPLEPEPPDAVDAPRDIHRLGVERLSFSYDGANPVLSEVSFEAMRGQVVAIVGPTGAGKTTLLDLLTRFYRPTQGVIRVDGVDLQKVKRKSLLGLIALVSQDPFLFNTSIRENIACGKAGATDAEIRVAAKAAYVEEFLDRVAGGLDYVVGERGESLSGGQRQRVTIARAFLKNAPILLLDEATSSLDAESERYVQEALRELMKGRLTFVIAHRLSTIQHADQILVLEGGRIVDRGTHEELLARESGFYKRAFEWQIGQATA